MSDSDHIPSLPKPPKPWLTFLIGGVLVCSGMIIGAGGTVLLVKHRLEQPDRAPSHFNRRLSERMTRDMGLTEEQETAIHAIFRDHQKELYSVRESVEQRIRESFNNMEAEVEAILTPEQMETWKNRIRKYNTRGERGRPPHERRPPRDEFDRGSEQDSQFRRRPPRLENVDGVRRERLPRRIGESDQQDPERRPPREFDTINDDRRPNEPDDTHRPPPQ